MQEVGHGDEGADEAEASGAGLGGLDEGGESFEEAVGDFRPKPVRDPVAVGLDGLCEAGQWIQAAGSGSSAPGVEEARCLGGGQPPEVLEGLLHLGRLHTCRRAPHSPDTARSCNPPHRVDFVGSPEGPTGGGGRGLRSCEFPKL
jgi:hypothetical protein